MREQAKFTYSPLGKAFKEQTKTFKEQIEEQVKVLKDLKLEDQTKSIEGILPKDQESNEMKNELHKIRRSERKLIKDNLFYESSKQVYDFKAFQTIKSFGNSIYNRKTEIHEANIEQADSLEHILDFDNKTKPKSDKD